MLNDPYYKRANVLIGIAVLVVLVYIIRLLNVQIIDQSTKEKAANNAQLRQTVYPARGNIYDRNSELMVSNQPVFDVMMIVHDMGHDFDTVGFCKALHVDKQFFDSRMEEVRDRKKNRGYSNYTPQLFMGQLLNQNIAQLQQDLFRYPGISIRCRTMRDYTYPIACHVLGSIGEVNQNDLDRDAYYTLGDYTGKDGVEWTYENQLRGEKGVEVLMRDSKGKIHGSYHDGELDKEPIAGQDLQLTLDLHLQILAERLLQGKIGSIVAIEPLTGEVLVMASAPSWDPKTLVGMERSYNYATLLADVNKPLLNRATHAQYSPGSTFKTLQALVCQQYGTLKPSTQYPCNGPESTPIKCTHHHGSPVDLESAIEQSCNPYFWAAFRDLLQQNDYGTRNANLKKQYAIWRNGITSFGLGNRFTDSDIPNQEPGYVPTEKLYNHIYGSTGWKAITIRSLSIGQGEILVTPLQLANQAATIANKGYYITPHLNRCDSMKQKRHDTSIKPSYFNVVQRGMARVMTNGTGRWYNIDSLHICGKTGTVQNSHGKDHAIFIGFAPLEQPKIAVAVVVENAGFGATWACPMASLIIEQYLTDEIGRKELLEKIETTHFIDYQ